MRDRATIFMLHRVANRSAGIEGHSAEQVRTAITALRESGANLISLRELVERWRARAAVANCVAFTIDDGFADQATLVRDVFTPLECPVTIFAISGFLDGDIWPWDDQLAFAFQHTTVPHATLSVGDQRLSVEIPNRERRLEQLERVRNLCKVIPNDQIYDVVKKISYALHVDIPTAAPPEHRAMTWDEARALESEGADIGPHSVSHRIFSRLKNEDAQRELRVSWNRLQKELRNPLPIFAWPTGRHIDFGEKDILLAKDLGMRACVATDDDYAHLRPNSDETDFFRLKRFSLPFDTIGVLRYGSWLERGRQLLPL
jgi:peptidoglycan/xylan/chitin deacetylase (PgdA/CDA1 family)